MAGGQHYSLRWNNHESHVLKAFDSLLQNEALVDCTLVCEDQSIRAHKVVLSACSPYFQKIFTDNPCKHPIIVLKDVQGWEVQCIVDFMYKGETSVPEDQLTSLIKAAEGLKVRGLIRSDQTGLTSSAHSSHNSRHNSPMPNPRGTPAPGAPGYSRSVHYSPSPARFPPSNSDEPHSKVPHIDQNSPMSLTTREPDDRHSAEDRCSAASSASARGTSPGPPGSGPRRKQARPRRRSGDSIGNASLDLSKGDSPNFHKSPSHLDDATPENLCMKRPSSSPAINLVKTETLMEDGRTVLSDNISDTSSTVDREHARALAVAAATAAVSTSADDRNKSTTPSNSDHFLSAFHSNGLQPHEHEARVEALQALNYMARGMGLPPLPHPHGGHPLAGHPAGLNGAPHMTPHHVMTSNAGGVIGRPTSTPSTGTSAFNASGVNTPRSKGQHSAPRGGPPRSWTNDELTKALENVWNRRMTTSQASRVYGIPYNSLLMYVRGKYGKSLKLDKLKETTPAAKDNLNTIGNSRSTPKEKMAGNPTSTNGNCPIPAIGLMVEDPNKLQKSKHGSGSSSGSSKGAENPPKTPLLENFENHPFMAAMTGIAGLAPLAGNDGSRVKDVMQQLQTRQAMLDHSERLKEFEKHMGTEQAKLLMPFFTGNGNLPAIPPTSPSTPVSTTESFDSTKENENHENFSENMHENLTEKERQVQEILIEATRGKQTNDQDDNNVMNTQFVPGMIEDNNKNMVDESAMKPLEVNQAVQSTPNAGAEISAS